VRGETKEGDSECRGVRSVRRERETVGEGDKELEEERAE